MQLLQHEQMWALAHARHQELLREAEQNRMVNSVQRQQPSLWQRVFQRDAEQTAAFGPQAAPELG